MTRGWVAVSLILAGLAGAVATDPHTAVTGLVRWVVADGGWALLVLAGVNVTRIVLPSGTLLGPLLISAAGSIILAVHRNINWMPTASATVAVVLAATAAAVLAWLPGPRSGTGAVLWVTRRTIRHAMPAKFTVLSILGTAELDLTTVDTANSTFVLRCRILGGRIQIRPPAGVSVTLQAAVAAPMVRISDTGPLTTDSAGSIVIDLVGFIGGLAVIRT